MHFAFRCASLDIITSYVFAISFNALDAEGFQHPLVVSIQRQQPFRWIIKYFPFILPTLFKMPKCMLDARPFKSFKELLEVRRRVTTQIDTYLADPKLLDDERETVYHHLIKDWPDYQRPSRKSLIEEAISLLQAGSHTVGGTCATGVFFVLNDPVVRRKLIDELQEAWPDKNMPMGYDKLRHLPYLVRPFTVILAFTWYMRS